MWGRGDFQQRLVLHQALARDIDLIAVPWTANTDTPALLVQRMCGALSGLVGRAINLRGDDWIKKPHGRQALTIILPGVCPEIDLSIMPCLTSSEPEYPE